MDSAKSVAAGLTSRSAEEVTKTEKPTGLSAKDLALYIGVPVATLCVAGGLYYYYTKNSDPKEGILKPTESVDGKTPVAVVAPQVSREEIQVKLKVALIFLFDVLIITIISN